MSKRITEGKNGGVEFGKFRRNILGTLSFEMKLPNMRQMQDFSVYPVQVGDTSILIQSGTRIGRIDMSNGIGKMSQSHPNGAYGVHLSMDKLVPFELSAEQLTALKEHLAKTAGSSVGSSVVKSDNSGADKFAMGGNVGGSIVAYANRDYANQIGTLSWTFSSMEKAKEFALKNSKKYDSITFEDDFGDNIVVTNEDTPNDIDWLFSEQYAEGGRIHTVNGRKVWRWYPEWTTATIEEGEVFYYGNSRDDSMGFEVVDFTEDDVTFKVISGSWGNKKKGDIFKESAGYVARQLRKGYFTPYLSDLDDKYADGGKFDGADSSDDFTETRTIPPRYSKVHDAVVIDTISIQYSKNYDSAVIKTSTATESGYVLKSDTLQISGATISALHSMVDKLMHFRIYN